MIVLLSAVDLSSFMIDVDGDILGIVMANSTNLTTVKIDAKRIKARLATSCVVLEVPERPVFTG